MKTRRSRMMPWLLILLSAALVLSLAGWGCSRSASSDDGSGQTSTTDGADGSSQTTDGSGSGTADVPVKVDYDSDDLDVGTDSTGMTWILLEGDSISVNGGGATVSGSIVTITAAGLYGISGTLNDGQVVVNAGDSDVVKIVLSGADITCSSSAAIYVLSADKTVITLAEGTANKVTDASSYVFASGATDEPSAAVFSKDDLTINGSGSLTVNGNYRNGIASKDDLKITGGQITVNAVNDGLRGRDCVAISDGSITVKAGADGIQSNNDEDAEKGFVCIEGGTLNITAGADGIQAETSVLVSGGSITVSCGGGSTKTVVSTASAKGIKAVADTTIKGGTISIDSADDALHSNGSLSIAGGSITIASGDDAIHSDSTIVIGGGTIRVTRCYEGIESGVVTINDGTIHITASDDGINVTAGYLYINGGYLAIDAGGDGLDVNAATATRDPMAGGSVVMTAGTVIINGPTASNNGALDFGTFKMTGGYLLAVGSSGMAQALSTTSTQYSVMVNFTSARAAGTMLHIQTQDGEDILTFLPAKAYQSVVLCTPALAKGTTCAVYTGGSSTGTAVDGLYSGGTYTPGTQYTTFTISSVVTTIGSTGGGGAHPGDTGHRGPARSALH